MSKEIMFSEAIKNGGVSKAAVTAGGLVALATSVAIVKPWGRVPYEHAGVLMNYDDIKRDKFGNDAPIIKGSGLRMKAPLKGALVAVDCRTRRSRLESTFTRWHPKEDGSLDSSDLGESWTFIGSAFWRVSPNGQNPYRSIRESKGGEELDEMVSDICLSALRSVFETVPKEQMRDEEVLDRKVFNRTWETLLPMGVEFQAIKVREIHPYAAQILASGYRGNPQPPTPSEVAGHTEATPGLGIVA